MDLLNCGKIIAATRTDKEFELALTQKLNVIFDLNPDLHTIVKKVKKAHEAGKKLFVHIDLATGIGKDESGLEFLKNIGIDGVISTRVNMIKLSHKAGLFTVQRFFIVDSHSVDTTVEAIKASKPDMIEIMPGIVTKVIKNLCQKMDTPIIAGGLVENEQEVAEIFASGASAVSTARRELWEL